MFKISTESDEFKGTKRFSTSFVAFEELRCFDDLLGFASYNLTVINNKLTTSKEPPSRQDGFLSYSFGLEYVEESSGEGRIHFYFCSINQRISSSIYPNWGDTVYLLIDGEKASLSNKLNDPPSRGIELVMYDLSVDVLTMLSNAQSVKYSMRGENARFEGELTKLHIEIFRAFQEFCFGNEFDGQDLVSKINNSLPDIDLNTSIIKPKEPQVIIKPDIVIATKENSDIKHDEGLKKKNTTWRINYWFVALGVFTSFFGMIFVLLFAKKTSSKISVIIGVVLSIVLVATSTVYFSSSDRSNSSSIENSSQVQSNDPGYYRIRHDTEDGIPAYSNVLKTKLNKRLIPPMSLVKIIKIENGLGYFDIEIDQCSRYEYPAGWVDMSKLSKSEMVTIPQYYSVKSSEIEGVKIFYDFSMTKKKKFSLKPMKEVPISYIIDGKGYISKSFIDGREICSCWIEMDKLEKMEN